MIKTILHAQTTPHIHPTIGRLYKLTFTDNTTALVWAETFFDQIKGWEPGESLSGQLINLENAFLSPYTKRFLSPDEVLRMRQSVGI